MFHASNRKPEVRQDGTSVVGIAVADLLGFRKDCGRIVELCPRKSTECWEFSGMFWASLEYRNLESNAEDGDLACDVSEGSLKTLSGSTQGQVQVLISLGRKYVSCQDHMLRTASGTQRGTRIEGDKDMDIGLAYQTAKFVKINMNWILK